MGNDDGQVSISKGRDLTARQRKFATKVLDGSSPTLVHAYRAVYDCKGDTVKQKKAQANEASRLWKHPGIVRYGEEFRKKAEAQRVRREIGERTRITERLWQEANDSDRASDRISALRLLGLEAGMFTERIEVKESNDELTDAEVLAEIEIALRDVIDVSSTSTNTVELVGIGDAIGISPTSKSDDTSHDDDSALGLTNNGDT
tara:strand:+ start:390 stop:998 length:609 start_codon:yes stop_codon:yes gene_type:complete